MSSFILVGEKNAETPTYLVSDTTYAKSAAQIAALAESEGVGLPVGTFLTKAGYTAVKQLGLDGTWTSL